MMVNELVQIHITGTVVRVNKESIQVHMTRIKYATNGKVICEYDIDETATFEFWKTVETAGKTVSLFKNSKYGIIKIAH